MLREYFIKKSKCNAGCNGSKYCLLYLRIYYSIGIVY